MRDYVKIMRKKIGTDCLILTASNVIIYDREGNYYFQKRANGKLAFFGGFVELDESVFEGLIREVYEESALELKPEKIAFYGMYTKFKMQYPNGDNVKPHSMFFKYQLADDEELKAIFPETIEVIKSKLSKDLPMLNVQHREVVADLMFNKEEIIFK